EVLERTAVVVLHREHGARPVAHQHHLRGVVEHFLVRAGDVEAAERVGGEVRRGEHEQCGRGPDRGHDTPFGLRLERTQGRDDLRCCRRSAATPTETATRRPVRSYRRDSDSSHGGTLIGADCTSDRYSPLAVLPPSTYRYPRSATAPRLTRALSNA